MKGNIFTDYRHWGVDISGGLCAYTPAHSQAFSGGFPSLLPSVTPASPPVLPSFCNLCSSQTLWKFFLSYVPFYTLFLLPGMPALLLKLSILQGFPTPSPSLLLTFSLYLPISESSFIPATHSHPTPAREHDRLSVRCQHRTGWSLCL